MPRNLDPNPYCASATTGRTAFAGSAPTRVTLASPWLRGSGSRSAASGVNHIHWGAPHQPGDDLSGRVFTAVVEWTTSAVPSGGTQAFLAFYDSAGTYFAASAGVTVASYTAGARQSTVVVATAPAGTFGVGGAIYAPSSTSTMTSTLGAVRVDEVNDPAMGYADGNTTGWSWDGAVGTSTSTQAVAAAGGGSFFPMLLGSELAIPPGFTPDLRDDFSNAPNGVLAGRTTPTEHTWHTFRGGGQPASDDPTVGGGAIGSPPGHVPGYGGSAKAGYATPVVPLARTVGWMGAAFRWDASTSNASGLCLLAGPVLGLAPADSGGCHIHLGLRPDGFEYAVWDNGINNFVFLTPQGGSSSTVTLPVPMATDGITQYRADIMIDRARNTAYVTVQGNPTYVYVDPRIGSVDARWPIWEYYSVPGGTNLPRFVRVWADRYRG